MCFVAGVRWGVRAEDAGSAHIETRYGCDRGRGLAPSSAARRHKAHCVGASYARALQGQRTSLEGMEVLTPRSLDEALRLRSEHAGAVPIEGGTDVMVELNFDWARPEVILNLNEVRELKGWSRDDGALRLGAGLTYDEAMQSPLSDELPALAEASRTVGSPQIRNRGTIGGNLGTASPAGDALPPLLVEQAEIELASVRGTRRMPVRDFLVGPKRNALEPDELIAAVLVRPSGSSQTFMKVGPRNAMVIAVCSLALSADRERGELRASFGSAGPVPGLVTAPLGEQESFPERVAEAASPIDDVRGTAVYRRHALRVLTARALDRCLA
jgi:CO/xanthine dehydrogenase FAD-binding subunit